MNLDLPRRWLYLGGFIALFAVALLAFFLRDVVRELVVEPLFYLVWLAGLVYVALPQGLLWALLVALGLYIFLRSFLSLPNVSAPEQDDELQYRARVAVWAHWIELARQGEWFKRKLGRELGELVVETLAHRDQLAPSEVRRRLQEEQLEIPKETLKVINPAPNREHLGRFRQFMNRLAADGRSAGIETEIERVVEYLETELEVPRDAVGKA